MKLFSKTGILAGMFGIAPDTPTPEAMFAAENAAKAAAAEPAARWAKAAARDRELLGDVLRLGGVLTTQPLAGGELSAPIDPLRLAYETGRRDMALQLATMMSLSLPELATMLEINDATV